MKVQASNLQAASPSAPVAPTPSFQAPSGSAAKLRPAEDLAIHLLAGEGRGEAPVGTRREREDKFIDQLVTEANRALAIGDHRVSVVRDETLKRFVMKVFDKETGEMIHQYPPEDIVQTARKLAELRGTLFEEEA